MDRWAQDPDCCSLNRAADQIERIPEDGRDERQNLALDLRTLTEQRAEQVECRADIVLAVFRDCQFSDGVAPS